VAVVNDNHLIRKNLALAYNIMAHLGLDDHTYTHLSSRAAEGDAFFIYPFGLRYDEVTTDSLMKVKFDGTVLEGNEYQYNKTGYVIHGAIYEARKDLNHVFHTHTVNGVAVSSMKQGLMPISQWALHLYDGVAYHDYDSLALDDSQGNRLISDLGNKFAMLMRNHGALTAGRTIHEALFYAYHLEKACIAQCLALSSGAELILPPKEVCEKTVKDLLGFEKDLGLRDWNAWVRLVKPSSLFNSKAA
jgi:ribulose-5-phosphate 4-epimerase/fuculose-1-phosphate aldolase